MQTLVHASYRRLWAWTDTGKVWWVELTMEDETASKNWASTGGTAEVTGSERSAEPQRGELLRWGGSSGDTIIPSGTRTVHRIGIGLVHTAASESLVVNNIGLYASAGPRAREGECAIPVLEQS
jgi:hypothetical protein